MDLHEPVNKNGSHLFIDLSLKGHVSFLGNVKLFCSKNVLKNLGTVLLNFLNIILFLFSLRACNHAAVHACVLRRFDFLWGLLSGLGTWLADDGRSSFSLVGKIDVHSRHLLADCLSGDRTFLCPCVILFKVIQSSCLLSDLVLIDCLSGVASILNLLASIKSFVQDHGSLHLGLESQQSLLILSIIFACSSFLLILVDWSIGSSILWGLSCLRWWVCLRGGSDWRHEILIGSL
jgi:hypothetical protein